MRLGLGISDARRPLRAPSLVAAPVVSGPADIAAGAVLTADLGVWARGRSFSRAWLRDGTPIPGATGSTYAVTAADALGRIALRVTASNPSGEVSASSAAVAVAAIADFRTGAPAGLANVSASGGWAPNAAGTYSNFAPNTSKITDLGLWVGEEFNQHIRNPTFTGGTSGVTEPTDTSIVPSGTFTVGTRDGLASIRVVAPLATRGKEHKVMEFRFPATAHVSWMPVAGDQVVYAALAAKVHSSTNLAGVRFDVQAIRRASPGSSVWVENRYSSDRAAADFSNAANDRWSRVIQLNNPDNTEPFEWVALRLLGDEAVDGNQSAWDIEMWGPMLGLAPPSLASSPEASGVFGAGAWRIPPVQTYGVVAADAPTLVIPNGADADTITVVVAGVTYTLTRAELEAANTALAADLRRITLPLGVGALPGRGTIPASGLAPGFRQTAAATPG